MANPLSEALRDYGLGLGEVVGSLGSSMLAQVPAGLAGLVELGRSGLDPRRAAERVREVQDALTYMPRTDVGQRGLENIGKAIEPVASTLREHIADPVGDRSPLLGAALLAGTELIGPGKAKPRQLHLPEVPRLTAGEQLAQAQQALERTKGGADFRSGGGQSPHHWQLVAERGREPHYFVENEGGVGPQDFFVHPGGVSAMHAERPEFRPDVARAQETLATILRQRADRDALRPAAAREEATEQAARARAQIEALRGKPEPEALRDAAERERQVLALKRQVPVITDEGVYRFTEGGGIENPQGMRLLSGDAMPDDVRTAVAAQHAQAGRYRDARRMADEYDEHFASFEPEPSKPAWVEQLNRENPGREGSLISRDHPAGPDWWHEQLGDPTKPSAEAFLAGARENPALFEFGLAPRGHTLEEIADEYGQRTGKRIDIEYEGGESDEPYKLKKEKTHGRGEIMRDRYGDYIMRPKEHERGDSPMYDEYGNVKKKKDEAGDVVLDEEGNPIKREARGGEPMRDRYGDEKYEYEKSEGGEPMYDERGRQKYKEVENPDYREPSDKIVLSVGRDNIEYTPGEGVYAINAGKHGKLLYQVLNSYALRAGEDIPSSSLTKDNQLRLLGNTLSTYARHGENPRNVSGTTSGNRPRARGRAGGFEMWNAEAGETERRVASMGGDPNRVQFDGRGFTIDGQPATGRDIKAQLDELSPGWDETKVGPQTLMRAAVLRHLAEATPEEAGAIARNWSKELGSLFAGVSALGVGAGLMREQSEAQ